MTATSATQIRPALNAEQMMGRHFGPGFNDWNLSTYKETQPSF